MRFIVRSDLLSKAKGDECLIVVVTDIHGKDKMISSHDNPKEAAEQIKELKKQYGNDVKVRVEKKMFTKKEWKPNTRGRTSGVI